MMQFALSKRNIAIISGIGICVFSAAVFLFFPLARAIRKNAIECNSLTDQLNVARTNLKAFQETGVSKRLIQEQEISSVIDTIAREGRSRLLNFKSISQEEIRPVEENHLVLPVNIDLEGDYKQLGLFFGALDNIKDAIVTVEEFQIIRDEKILPKISATVVLNIHLAKG